MRYDELYRQEHVKRMSAPYKYPRAIEFVAELPKNASGKLLRRIPRESELHNRAPVKA